MFYILRTIVNLPKAVLIQFSNSYLSHRIIDSFSRILKLKIKMITSFDSLMILIPVSILYKVFEIR